LSSEVEDAIISGLKLLALLAISITVTSSEVEDAIISGLKREQGLGYQRQPREVEDVTISGLKLLLAIILASLPDVA
jgi:hypothetical protein